MVEFQAGEMRMYRYRLGNQLRWSEAEPAEELAGYGQWVRPPNGHHDARAYAACDLCDMDFHMVVHIRHDIIVGWDLSLEVAPYCPSFEDLRGEPEDYAKRHVDRFDAWGMRYELERSDDEPWAEDFGCGFRIPFDGGAGLGCVFITGGHEGGTTRTFYLNYPWDSITALDERDSDVE